MKNTRLAGENQSDHPMTVESLATMLRDHTASQVDTNRRFAESFHELERNAKAMESRIEETLEAKIEACYEKMCDRLEKKLSKSIDVSDESPPPYRHPNYQVHNSTLEPGRSIRNEDVSDRTTVVGSRERMLKRVELPVYDGCDAYGWLALAEHFFRIGGYDDRAKLDMVSVSLAGDVLSWFNSESHRRGFRSWMEFKQKLIARFNKEKFRDPSQPFFAVKKTGTAAQYIHAFEDLSTLVTGLTDTQLEGIFMNGLKPEMREVLLVKLEIVIGMGGTDAKDILGLPKTPLSLAQEKRSRPQKESHRKPDGISREVAWQWLPVKSSARSDDLQLFHWVCSLALEPYYTKVEHLILSNVMCIVRLEWLMMFHHQSVDVLKYTDDEYENHLTDPVWTKEETDQLFELCERFDLRFTVIADRFPLSRTLEELKDRYYSGMF
ncbi:hypothetical protein Bca101_101029 [Brassica carinata]